MAAFLEPVAAIRTLAVVGVTMATQGKISASLAPSPSNRSELQKQATNDLRRDIQRYARQRAALVRRAGRRIDDLYARELVQDALADTWVGTETWNPDTCSLQKHLRRLIRRRSWKDAIGARQRPHLSIDRDPDLITEIDEAHRHGTQGTVSPLVVARLTATLVREMRSLADGDPRVTAILVSWEDGLIDRDDVMSRTGLSSKDYKAARDRLMYLVPSLPQWLRETGRTLLRGMS